MIYIYLVLHFILLIFATILIIKLTILTVYSVKMRIKMSTYDNLVEECGILISRLKEGGFKADKYIKYVDILTLNFNMMYSDKYDTKFMLKFYDEKIAELNNLILTLPEGISKNRNRRIKEILKWY